MDLDLGVDCEEVVGLTVNGNTLAYGDEGVKHQRDGEIGGHAAQVWDCSLVEQCLWVAGRLSQTVSCALEGSTCEKVVDLSPW